MVPTIQQLITFITKRIKTPEQRRILRENGKFKDIHKGKRCFILATGSSIKTQDLKLLKDEICIAVSGFYLHPDITTIAPRYYCVPAFCFPLTESYWDDLMKAITTHTDQKTTHFFSLFDKERCTRTGQFEGRDIHFLDFTGSFRHGTIDLNKSIPAPQSVSVMAIETAIYMGFSEIYLLGCDHDWFTHVGTSVHMYEEKQSVHHVHNLNEWEDSKVEDQLKELLVLWGQYKQIKKIADQQNTKIFNATNGGLLDVFPRKQYEFLFPLPLERYNTNFYSLYHWRDNIWY